MSGIVMKQFLAYPAGAALAMASLARMVLADGADRVADAAASGGTMVRVAAISLVPVKFDLPGNAKRLEQAFRQAQQGGAKIAVAPEGVLEGYVVNEVIAGKAKPEAMREVALAMDDPVIRRFQELARELQMCLVFGFAERVGGEIFNGAVFVDETGRIRGSHHKMQFAEGCDPDWWFNRPGMRCRTIDTPYGRCGILICNERWNPQLARILALDGAQFLVIPSYGTRSTPQDEAVLRLGRENGLPVVEANVGVTLVADRGKIVAVDRKEEGITFGEIGIPPVIPSRPAERDKLEGEFLAWRDHEMKVRREKALAHPKDPGATAGIGLELVRIPAGEFVMGSPPTEKGRRADEPQRRVRLTKDFFIGRYEVTRGQFRKFVEATKYKTDAERGLRGGYGYDEKASRLAGPDHQYSWKFTGFAQTDEHPVVNVSWNDAVAFCRWLTEIDKRAWRLPTEAEWEYACRGGATTAFANGDDPEKVIELGNIMDAPAKLRFPDRIAIAGSDGFIFTAPVGSFRPNGFGIHDMHGNVWEWTADWFGPPVTTPQADPQGPDQGRDKVIRGGDWYHDWSFARSAQRFPIYPSLCRRHAGFRVVREVAD